MNSMMQERILNSIQHDLAAIRSKHHEYLKLLSFMEGELDLDDQILGKMFDDLNWEATILNRLGISMDDSYEKISEIITTGGE